MCMGILPVCMYVCVYVCVCVCVCVRACMYVDQKRALDASGTEVTDDCELPWGYLVPN